ncbi:MAG: DNA methyltransferase [Candidatus Zipacnadales bacterium]
MTDELHPRNRLNDLSNREWLKATKSFWIQAGYRPPTDLDSAAWEAFVGWLREQRGDEATERLLEQVVPSFVFSRTPPRSELKTRHPATFSELDVARLIYLFTKRGGRVLDPFVGTGSTLIACAHHDRQGTGIELSPQWAEVARRRLAEEGGPGGRHQRLIEGDARTELPKLPPAFFDLLLTSPPYWSMLRKTPGLKAQAERVSRGLATHYGESAGDLGNIGDYESFLEALGAIFSLAVPTLKPQAYVCVIVSDFRHGPRFILHHADVARTLEAIGLPLKGVTILAQDNKNLYPFGIPHHFVSNIHHQYILIHQYQP